MTPEGHVKEKVKALLRRFNVYYFMPVMTGMGKPGLDFYCCYRGLFFAIETKAEGNKLTPRQEVTRDEIAKAGGEIFVIIGDYGLTQLALWLGSMGQDARTPNLTLTYPPK